MAGRANQPSDRSQRVNNVGYHLDQLSKNLTLRDLIHTPHRVVWHVSDHPEQIPIMVAALFVLGGISIFWSPFIFVIDTLFIVSVATHLVIHGAHLSGASKAENRDDSGKYRGLRAAQSRIAISNQVMWVVPFVRPLTKRYVSLFQSARKSYGQMRDFRKACEILELPYAKPHRITMRTVKNALKEFQIKLHPDRFVRTPELQAQNLRRLEEMLKAADHLGGLLKSRGSILNARIPTTNSEVLRAYEVLRMKPGTSLAKVHRRLDLRGTRIEALRRAGKAMKHQQSKFEAKAQELEVSLSKGRAAAEVLAQEASKLDVALTASELKGRMLGILIQRFIRSKSGKPWKPDMDIVEENPLLLPEYSQAQLNFPVPSFGEILARAKGAA